ncbi:putative LRR receptor-like serine/threonine-protein kinase [Capsicum annuum]|uniref:probable LRR receptor-like serine/threonine-protein kinase At3g47570 n=1 Tax=Capsicum annuum TaxID=4072 RepID=UPI001FB19FAB|nr:probable LRR receptor-like serine/threonine-protein kinase At3g47570 [Capsicum annuum]
MTGVLPAELGNFKKLQQLDLSHSKVTGSVRASIFNISALQLLGLHLNKLSGTLPSNLGRGMPNREQFLYGGNNLSGFVSASISNSSRLRVIDLAGNDFTGSIPESLGNLEYLEVLSLGKNSFFSDSTFSFLASLTNCRNLRVLSFSDNPLDGVLPTPIGNLSNSLLCFEGDGCKLKGVIPQEIGNLTRVTKNRLFSNELSGHIPNTLKCMLNPQEFYLQSNKIEGAISMSYEV